MIGMTEEDAIREAKRLIAGDGIAREVIRNRVGGHWILRAEAEIFYDPADEWILVWPKE
jgi:hypothetical protein